MDCQHKTHPEIIKRLKRAHGQLNGIIEMLEEDNHQCVDIAQQMQAVYRAVGTAKINLVQDHIQGCIENSRNLNNCEMEEMIEGLRRITKYL